jgi:hypothetical protein
MYDLTICRNKQSVSDAVLEKEKDKPIGQVFDGRFSWAALIDAVADVYLGVCLLHPPSTALSLISGSSRFGRFSLAWV